MRAELRIWQFRGVIHVNCSHSSDILFAFILEIQSSIATDSCCIVHWHVFCTGRGGDLAPPTDTRQTVYKAEKDACKPGDLVRDQ